MKHTPKITLILLLMFIITQVVGLAVVDNYIDHKTLAETGEVTFKELPYSMERPELDESVTLPYLILAIAIGTLLVLLLIKFQKVNLWKVWFALAVGLCLTISLKAFMPQAFALALAIIFTYWKVFKPNIYVHNLTEVFIYGGLAAIFVPIKGFTILIVSILLVIISIYDFIAVFKSKHMVKMAKFQGKTKMFAGLLVPYKLPKMMPGKAAKGTETKKVNVKTAVLGGGDMGFPLLFAGVVMKWMIQNGQAQLVFLKILVIPLFAAFGLAWLLWLAKKDKFYPAMPFITAGCFVGYGVLLLINLI